MAVAAIEASANLRLFVLSRMSSPANLARLGVRLNIFMPDKDLVINSRFIDTMVLRPANNS